MAIKHNMHHHLQHASHCCHESWLMISISEVAENAEKAIGQQLHACKKS